MTSAIYNFIPAILTPVLTLLGMGLGIGALLAFISRAFHLETDPVVARINDLLPQTQCGQCGYPGCKPYAEAVAGGDAINKCPPGGDRTIRNLAELLNVQVLPLDENYGHTEVKKVAFIREAECIGCAKCIPACPVDAILGAPKFMHTVLENECTGCDLCIEPCPVDCIDLITVKSTEQPLPIQSLNDSVSMACINCGLCVDECPVDILPHELYWACRSEELEKADSLNLMHCIECGKCDKVCPSRIPLMAYYQTSKQNFKSQQLDKVVAEKARRRFENHQGRMTIQQSNEDQRRRKRAELAKANRDKVSGQDIKAALARVKARKKPDKPAN